MSLGEIKDHMHSTIYVLSRGGGGGCTQKIMSIKLLMTISLTKIIKIKKKKKIIKSKILNLANLYTAFVETHHRSMPGLLGVILLCTFRGDVV